MLILIFFSEMDSIYISKAENNQYKTEGFRSYSNLRIVCLVEKTNEISTFKF